MITINAKNIETLRFKVAVAYVDIASLKARFIMAGDSIEYGLPATINDAELKVNLPPLSNVVKELKNNQKFDCRLEVIANDTLLVPYADTVLIKIPVEIKAKLKNQKTNETIYLDKLDKIINEQRAKNLAREIDDKLRFKLRRKK